MPYQYGMQNSPPVGNGLPQRRPPVTATRAPGLPRRLGGNALQALFTYTATDFRLQQEYAFVVPIGVAFVDAVCIGGGQSGGGGDYYSIGNGGVGGSLRWITRMPVTPGETLRVFVGRGGSPAYESVPDPAVAGNASYIARVSTSLLYAHGGGQSASSTTPFGVNPRGGFVGGGNGGAAGSSAGGSGAGGYFGDGGRGGSSTPSTALMSGSGGGGGGGGRLTDAGGRGGGGGGGVGVYQAGSNGIPGLFPAVFGQQATMIVGGGGGSGGQIGFHSASPVFYSSSGGSGGAFGGGGGCGGNGNSSGNPGGSGGNGAVRIIWGGGSRSYPYNSKLDIFR